MDKITLDRIATLHPKIRSKALDAYTYINNKLLGKGVRLRFAYVIRCTDVIYDEQGGIQELRCTYDDQTLGKKPEGRKVKGVIHWVAVNTAHPIEIYQYDRLFHDENPGREEDFLQFLNHDSKRIQSAYVEPAMASRALGEVFQFERLGYYCVNTVRDGIAGVFHRVVGLKDTWGKLISSDK